ncbi:winged helix-turn-helix transcriptional regulator [Rhizobium mesoamericanum]|uniref:Putative two component transcriptional regulator, winged helix family n=1 Tax=Rhizobium mesoamericanum STM3625 TaxID=1211777 RepID=K0Q6A9_9HYPH|nr:response regulator transcription factor [Rhizobium mesoamericanum]CCM79539.1 putative two component transcriptional regulator, winged helix family [Rhizobium mesoamericanum STM3625]
MRPTIVIGSGDGDLCFIARYLLDQAGYETNLQPEADDTVLAVRRVSACALLIDGRLPGAISTCEALCTLRAQRQLVVVALVDPGAHGQGLAFLNAGADEVFTRPVPPTHLVRALIAPVANRRLIHGDLKMDLSARRVWRASVPLYLPRIEFAILRCFLLDPDRVFDRRTIIRNCWPNRVFVDPKTVNVHVGRLRKRLQAKGASDPIRSVRGIGYGLQAADLSEVKGGGNGV